MPSLNVDGLTFDFPVGWVASKYDEWAFYRNQFAKQGDGIKAVDILAVSDLGHAYLIEVKDYRHPLSVKPSGLTQAVFDKVMHTLAAVLPAKLNASSHQEQQYARQVIDSKQLSIVVHIEQPKSSRKLIDPADLRMQLRKKLKAIDPHCKITEGSSMSGVPWRVQDTV